MQAATRAPTGGITTSQSPPFILPIRYMILGVIGFGLFAIDLVLQSIGLSQNDTLMPSVVALTHILTLGSLLAFVMGAVYQLATVAFLIPIKLLRLARLNFWLYAVSVTGLIFSMGYWWMVGLLVFGTCAVVSIYLYAVIIVWSVAKTKVTGAMKWFVLCAHVYLMIAVTLALLLILSMQFAGFLAGAYQPLLLSHIIFAAGGFFTLLVMGFSFKLLPMFTLSHGYSTARQKFTLILANVALWGLIAGVWLNLRGLLWIAGTIGVITFINHVIDLKGIMKKRLRKNTEAPMHAVMIAAYIGGVTLLGLLIQLGVSFQLPGWQVVVTFYLLGWITFTVMGFSYKIIPFLIWNERFSKKVGKEKTPMIADLLHPNRTKPVLIGFLSGLVLLTIFTVVKWVPGTVIGSVLIGSSLLVFCTQLIMVISPKNNRKELRVHD